MASREPCAFEIPERMALCITCAFSQYTQYAIVFPAAPHSPCALHNVQF